MGRVSPDEDDDLSFWVGALWTILLVTPWWVIGVWIVVKLWGGK